MGRADERAGDGPDEGVRDLGDGDVLVLVRAQPGASRAGVVGRHGAAVRLRVTAPADRGRANAALAELLAEVLGVRRGAVGLEWGSTGRDKAFRVAGISADAARERLDAAVAGAGGRGS